MHERLIQEIVKDVEISEEIEKMLPADGYRGFTIISMAVDKYAHRVGLSSGDCWKMLYNVAMLVHEEQGNYMEDKE